MEREVALDQPVARPDQPVAQPVDQAVASAPSPTSAPAAGVAAEEPPEAPPAWWLIPIFLLCGASLLISAAIFGGGANKPWKSLIAVMAIQLGCLLSALTWARVSGFRVLALLRVTRPSIAALLLGAGTAVAGLLAMSGLTSLLFMQGLLTRPVRSLPDQFKHFPDPWLHIALFGLLPALCEEFFFRGALQTGLLRRFSPAAAIALTAVLFVAFHGEFAFAPGRLIVGLTYGWLAWRTGSLWPGMLAHALHNGLVFLNWKLSIPEVGQASPHEAPDASVIALAVGVLGYALLALAARRWLPPAPAAASFLRPRVGPAVASSPEATAAGT